MALTVTEKAINEIKRIQAKDPDGGGTYLRVMIVGGGCSGMSYKLSFDSKPHAATDRKIETEGVTIVIDAKSSFYLESTELDFTDGLDGSGFVFNNPNAKRTCGCGSSFSA
jgi:iron-sulfur cluster assembly protein